MFALTEPEVVIAYDGRAGLDVSVERLFIVQPRIRIVDDGQRHAESVAELSGTSQVDLSTVRSETDPVLDLRRVTSLIQRSITYQLRKSYTATRPYLNNVLTLRYLVK